MNSYGDPALDLSIALAQPTTHDAVLDYACGVGKASFALAPSVKVITAVDEQPEALEEGRRLAAELGFDTIGFKLADLYSLPFPEDTFSLVICVNGLHRLPQPVAALHEMTRVMSPGGRLVMLESRVSEETDRAFNEIARLREPAHRRFYRREELLDIVAQAGLRVIDQMETRQTVDLDYWVEAAAVSLEKADLIRTRVQDLPVEVQAKMDIAFSDRTVSFSYDVTALRLER